MRWTWKRRIAIGLLIVAVLLIVQRRAILAGFGKWLVVSEEPIPCDVIIVLGGESGHRVLKAIELYQQGYSAQIAVTGGAAEFPEVEPPPYERWLHLLDRGGIPRSSIDLLVPSHSTYDDAMLTRNYLIGLTERRFIVLTIKGITDATLKEVMEYGLDEVQNMEVKTSTGPLFTHIKIADPAKPFVAKFHRAFSKDNRAHAMAIAEAISSDG